MPTLDYYNKNADAFCSRTVNTDMSSVYARFEPRLPAGAKILDLGCGSGRDARHFLDAGFSVTAMDGSPELCRRAQALLGEPVRCMRFGELDFRAEFDAVWASASLLHVPKAELPAILERICRSLKPGGIFYASFKYGDSEREDAAGRFYADYSEQSLPALCSGVPALALQDFWISREVRPEEGELRWLNAVWKKEDALPDNTEIIPGTP